MIILLSLTTLNHLEEGRRNWEERLPIIYSHSASKVRKQLWQHTACSEYDRLIPTQNSWLPQENIPLCDDTLIASLLQAQPQTSLWGSSIAKHHKGPTSKGFSSGRRCAFTEITPMKGSPTPVQTSLDPSRMPLVYLVCTVHSFIEWKFYKVAPYMPLIYWLSSCC